MSNKWHLKQESLIYILLIIAIIIGLFIFKDFGVSWDEPDYYRYAKDNLNAYSIGKLIDGTYDLEKSLGQTDLRFYGPAYLFFGKLFQLLVQGLFPGLEFYAIWHLFNYLFFLLGVFFFYKIVQRWVSPLASIAATALFASQPVFFGSSWFNPKDVPFMVFFLGAIFFGLFASDHLKEFIKRNTDNSQADPKTLKGNNKKKTKIILVCINSLILALSALVLINRNKISQFGNSLVMQQSQANPNGMINRKYLILANLIKGYTLNNYANHVSLFIECLAVLLIILTAIPFIFVFSPKLTAFFANKRYSLKQLFSQLKSYPKRRSFWFNFLGTCIFTGFACATRVPGIFIIIMLALIWIKYFKRDSLFPILFLTAISGFVCYAFWPFLWKHPIINSLYVLKRTISFPDVHNQMFAGKILDSTALPASYLPVLSAISLTEAAVLLFLFSLPILTKKVIERKEKYWEILVCLLWFMLPFLYTVIATPALYDNYRQLLFILPPVFFCAAFSIEWIFSKVRSGILRTLLTLIILFSGIYADIDLHPYEYSYYNVFTNGLPGAARKYEVDYWLTCYRELTEQIDDGNSTSQNLLVAYAPELVKDYANSEYKVYDLQLKDIQPGDLILLPIRWNTDLTYLDYPIEYAVQKDGVNLCVAKFAK